MRRDVCLVVVEVVIDVAEVVVHVDLTCWLVVGVIVNVCGVVELVVVEEKGFVRRFWFEVCCVEVTSWSASTSGL